MPVTSGEEPEMPEDESAPTSDAPRIIQHHKPEQPQTPNIVAFETTMYRGSVPHPSIAQGWEDACPGGADRLLTMAERQSEHRQKMEEMVLPGNIQRANLGLYAGLTIGIVGLTVAGLVGIYGSAAVGGIIGVADLGVLVGSFIYGSQGQRRERIAKDKQREAVADGQNAGSSS